MYLFLQADQKLKQNQEDLPLLAHLQELYLSVKDIGLILSLQIFVYRLPSVKKTEHSSSAWTFTSTRRTGD